MRKGGIVNKILFLLFCVGLLSLAAVSAMAAASRRGRAYDQQGGMPQSPAELRRQEMEQQAQQASGLIDRALDDFFTQINNWKDPEEIYVKSAAVLLEDNRRYMMYMSDPQKGRYMLLQGWVDYCTGDLAGANTNSARACRMDATNRDAWISQQYFAILDGKRPLQPRPPRPQTARRSDMMEPAGDYSAGQSLFGITGKLDFDPESLREDLIGRTLEPFTAAFHSGTSMTYRHDKEILCLLVREIAAEDLEEKDETETGEQLLYTRTEPTQANYTYDESGGGYAEPARSDEGLEEQLAALASVQKQASESKDLFFFSVITNKASQKEEVTRYLAGKEQSLPLLLANGTVKDLAIPIEEPFILVVDKTGLYRFAGSGQGFLLPMLLGRLTGITFTKQTQAGQAAPQGEINLMEGRGMRPMMVPDSELFSPGRRMGDPNAPAGPVDPNAPTRRVRPPRARPVQLPAPRSQEMMQDLKDMEIDPVDRIPTQDLTPEDLCGAKELAYARDLFLPAAGRKFIQYRRGIDLCRQVIRNCPNSENAKAARQLLRTAVPEDRRAQFNLTNEELGL